MWLLLTSLCFPGDVSNKRNQVPMQEIWDMGSVPGLGTSPGGGYGNPFNPMDRGAWQAIVHRVTKWKVKVKVIQSRSTLWPWNSPGQNTGVGSLLLLQGSSQPRSPTLLADSLPAELQGKPKNTGVGSLSLLQRIFLTQTLNRGLLHCRQILYQLSYESRKESNTTEVT